MATPNLKRVFFHEDQRLDLDDMEALGTLNEEQLNAFYKFVHSPGVNGKVISGLSGTVVAGPTFSLGAVDHIAIDADGRILLRDAGSSLSVNVPNNATVYIHAYATEVDSDSDNRKFINDLVDPAEENTVNVYTRKAKALGLYFTSNADATPSLASFSQTAVIGGVTRKLVAVCAFKTSSNNLTPSSFRDFRHSLFPNGSAYSVTQYPDEVGAISNSQPSTGIFGGVWDVFRNIAAILSLLFRTPNNSNLLNRWMDPSAALLNPATATPAPRGGGLFGRFLSDRPFAFSVGPLEVGGAPGDGDVELGEAFDPTGDPFTARRFFLHNGSYSQGDGYTWADGNQGGAMEGETAEGVIISSNTATPTIPILDFVVSTPGNIVENVTFYDTKSVTVPMIRFNPPVGGTIDRDVPYVEFRNCVFSSTTRPHFAWGQEQITHVKFINCKFVFGAAGVFGPLIFSDAEYPSLTEFIDCEFIATGLTSVLVAGRHDGLARFTNCEFRNPSDSGWNGIGFQKQVGRSGSTPGVDGFEFINCRFQNVERFYYGGNGGFTDGGRLKLDGCEFWRTIGGTVNTQTLITHVYQMVLDIDRCSIDHPCTVAETFDGPTSDVSIYRIRRTRFWSSASANFHFISVLGYNVNSIIDIDDCRFEVGNRTGHVVSNLPGVGPTYRGCAIVVAKRRLSGTTPPAVTGAMYVNIRRCVFDAQRQSKDQHFIFLWWDAAAAATTGTVFVNIDECRFIRNTHTTCLPIGGDEFTPENNNACFRTTINHVWQNGGGASGNNTVYEQYNSGAAVTTNTGFNNYGGALNLVAERLTRLAPTL